MIQEKEVLEKFPPNIRKCGSDITTWPGAGERKISATEQKKIILWRKTIYCMIFDMGNLEHDHWHF